MKQANLFFMATTDALHIASFNNAKMIYGILNRIFLMIFSCENIS
ncbi:MAG: hypothetical protein JWR05_2080 [Mucilaginibacter sp.]|nr:hypothetical protein [Mucilaginibacter sp.]